MAITTFLIFSLFLSSPGFARESNLVLNSMILRPLNFVDEVTKGFTEVETGIKNPGTCVEFISDKLDKIDRLESDSFFPQNKEQIEELEAKGIETLHKLFRIRLLIRHKQQQVAHKNGLSYDCLQNIRRSTRYVRFMEDMLIEWLVERKIVTNFSNEILSGSFPQLMTNLDLNPIPKEPMEFKIGDLFLIRGKSYVSGMIARIGDTELQFSHLAILGENENKEPVIVEALIPYGTRMTPLNDWLKQKEARVVLFRYKHPEVARKAGKAAFELGSGYLKKMGHTIPYDFNMISLNSDAIFCAELIENAYLTGSDSKVHLPEHKTLTTKFRSTQFLKNMGIEATEIFAPGDIEFDSRFDLVGEYRFLGKYDEADSVPLLRKVRMQDAIIQSLYNWMIVDHYQFEDTWKINLKTGFAKIFRYLSFFKDRFPTHMPFSSLKTVMQFEDTSHLLEERLFPIESAFYTQKKHSMNFQEMLKILKDYRDDECRTPKIGLTRLISAAFCAKIQ